MNGCAKSPRRVERDWLARLVASQLYSTAFRCRRTAATHFNVLDCATRESEGEWRDVDVYISAKCPRIVQIFNVSRYFAMSRVRTSRDGRKKAAVSSDSGYVLPRRSRIFHNRVSQVDDRGSRAKR